MSSNSLDFFDLDEQDYKIIAITSLLRDYKLAYFLNDALGSKLTKIVPDLDYVIKDKKVFFSSYRFNDIKNLADWYLVENKYKFRNDNVEALGLFKLEDSFRNSYVYLQPELKDVDYIIKIQGDFIESNLEEILKQINNIESIDTAYVVDITKLNHKEYLIF